MRIVSSRMSSTGFHPGGSVATSAALLLWLWYKQGDRHLAKLCGGSHASIKCGEMRSSRLRKSDRIAVGDRFCGRLKGKGYGGLPEQSLSAARLGREFHARVLHPAIVQLECSGKVGCAIAHYFLIREQAQKSEHCETAEQKHNVVDGAIPVGSWGMLRVLIPRQRQPHVDINQIRGHRASRYWGTVVQAGLSP